MDFFATIGRNPNIHSFAKIGFQYRDNCRKTKIGDNAVIEPMALIYANVTIGHNFRAGHGVVIRGNCRIGNNVTLESGVNLEGNVELGDNVRIESHTFISEDTKISNNVHIGANSSFQGDDQKALKGVSGPVILEGVWTGSKVKIYPGVTVGKGSYIVTESVVTQDVPAKSMAKGVPAKIMPLPANMKNKMKSGVVHPESQPPA